MAILHPGHGGRQRSHGVARSTGTACTKLISDLVDGRKPHGHVAGDAVCVCAMTGSSVHGGACRCQRRACAEAWGEGGRGAAKRGPVCPQGGGQRRLGPPRCYADYVGPAMRPTRVRSCLRFAFSTRAAWRGDAGCNPLRTAGRAPHQAKPGESRPPSRGVGRQYLVRPGKLGVCEHGA